MDNCIFCKIIKGEIPSYKIYEDEFVYAFLDISGDNFGHTLVVPKKHCENILDAGENELKNCLNVVQKIAKHYTTDCGFDGVHVFNNTGKCAGQSVMHLHFHIVPRKNGDELPKQNPPKPENMQFEEIVKKLHL